MYNKGNGYFEVVAIIPNTQTLMRYLYFYLSLL